ncbi:unnamed protein product [Nesidiocoris tenuis]|nr:unnamed protein product [Nesidiocoris tenuis]
MENVNFKADIDDILQFFSGFDIDTEDVIRRFDDLGRPTGDARVCFKSPEEARRALDSRNFQMMCGRSVKLNFV